MSAEREMAALAAKAPRGAACTRCGLCCMMEPCHVSDELDLWVDGACKALERHGAQYQCGLLTDPGRYIIGLEPWAGQYFGELLGIGQGCDADDAP